MQVTTYLLYIPSPGYSCSPNIRAQPMPVRLVLEHMSTPMDDAM